MAIHRKLIHESRQTSLHARAALNSQTVKQAMLRDLGSRDTEFLSLIKPEPPLRGGYVNLKLPERVCLIAKCSTS